MNDWLYYYIKKIISSHNDTNRMQRT